MRTAVVYFALAKHSDARGESRFEDLCAMGNYAPSDAKRDTKTSNPREMCSPPDLSPQQSGSMGIERDVQKIVEIIRGEETSSGTNRGLGRGEGRSAQLPNRGRILTPWSLKSRQNSCRSRNRSRILSRGLQTRSEITQ